MTPGRRLPVAHIITMLELGGAQQNTLYTAAHLDPARFSPAVVSGPGGMLDAEARAATAYEFHTIPHLVREISPRADALAFAELTSWLRAWKSRHGGGPAAVHTHSSKAGILGRLAARAAGCGPIIHSIHGFGFHDGMPKPVRAAFIAAERAARACTGYWLAVSQANLDEGVRLGIVDGARAEVLHSGIPLAEFTLDPTTYNALRAQIRAELSWDAKTPVVGMIGNLKPQKCPEDFIRTAAFIRKQMPEARFFIAGDGPGRTAVEALIRREHLSDAVRLFGWRRDVPALLAAMDVLLLTSLWEGLPRVFPQAMAVGVPIVATRVNGAAEAVRHGRNGYLHNTHDVAALAASAIYLLRQRDRGRAMGLTGRDYVSNWDIDAMVRRQEEVYLALAGRRRVAGAARR